MLKILTFAAIFFTWKSQIKFLLFDKCSVEWSKRGLTAVPSRMLKLQFILFTLELGLKENVEI